jgi:hypothetical protein
MTCLYFPPIGDVEYLTNKYGVKRRINSKPYRCLYDNKIINWDDLCPNCTFVTKEVKKDEC